MITDPLRRPIVASIAAATLTLGLKAIAYFATGSVGLLSDAAESLVNVIASLMAYWSLWYAAQPVDRNHAFGHEKIEFFSSGLEGAMICCAGVGIAVLAAGRLFDPPPLARLEIGVVIALVATAINAVVGIWLLRVGRQHDSIVLEADGQHLLTDVWTTLGVVVGLVLAALTGWRWLDPLLALAVAGVVLWHGVGLVRRSFDGLMDHALPDRELEAVRAAIRHELPAGSAFHAVRSRQAGARRFVDFHLLVPGSTVVRTAHDHAERIEAAVRAVLPGVEVVVHIEPIEEAASWTDSALLPFEPEPPVVPEV